MYICRLSSAAARRRQRRRAPVQWLANPDRCTWWAQWTVHGAPLAGNTALQAVDLAMALDFEWDLEKATAKQKKHGVSFEEASTVFGDPLSVTIMDPDHSEHEHRLLILGCSRT